jgi:hypothetical protein
MEKDLFILERDNEVKHSRATFELLESMDKLHLSQDVSAR